MRAMAHSLIWWPKHDQEMEQFVRYCNKCQTNRQSDSKAPVPFWIKSEQPWSRFHVDFAGPVKGKVFLVIVDTYSKWVQVEIMLSMTSTAVIRSLQECFATHGLPHVIVSDNGTAFTSQEMQDFLRSQAECCLLCVHSSMPSCKQWHDRVDGEGGEGQHSRSNCKDILSVKSRDFCSNSTPTHSRGPARHQTSSRWDESFVPHWTGFIQIELENGGDQSQR